MTTLMHGMLTASSIFWFTPIATGALFLANVWLVAAAMWLLVAAVSGVDGWLRLSHTKPFRGPDGSILPHSVAEVRYVRLGGVNQWVLIRGENAANPPLIVLHGGPGMSEMGFFRRFNAPLERQFTVVHWDQRGTGKSFDRRIPKSSMTLDQFVADLDELVDIVRRRFGKEKVAILGHSWGSALGPIYAARFPEKVSVYVGAAQIGGLGGRRVVVVCLRTRRSGAPPRRGGAEETARDRSAALSREERVRRAHGSPANGWTDEPGNPAGRWHERCSAAPESSIFDLPNLVRGFGFTLDAMWADVSKLNLLTRCAGLDDACGLLRRAPRSLGAARDERGVFRGAYRAVEEAGVVRPLRARSVRRRTREVQLDDGGVGAAARFTARERARTGAVARKCVNCVARMPSLGRRNLALHFVEEVFEEDHVVLGVLSIGCLGRHERDDALAVRIKIDVLRAVDEAAEPRVGPQSRFVGDEGIALHRVRRAGQSGFYRPLAARVSASDTTPGSVP